MRVLNRRFWTLVAVLVASARVGPPAFAQDAAFSYQGELLEAGGLANGAFDMAFSLWTAAAGGSQVGSTVLHEDVPVDEGRFTVQIDFGPEAFANGRWLEIAVAGDTLSPRQPITRSPLAIQTRGLFVDEEGEVGIGTTAPAASLEIAGEDAGLLLRSVANSSGARITLRNTSGGSSTVTGRISFEDPSLLASIGYVKPLIGPNGLQFTGAADVHMKITAAGRVGIGTLDPSSLLHVAGDALFRANDQGSVHFVENTSTTLTATAITGRSAGAAGVRGFSTRPSGNTYGVVGTAESTSGTGVRGVATATSGDTVGVEGRSESGTGIGVYGLGFAQGGRNYGVWAESRSPQGRAVYGVATAPSGNTIGILGQVNSPNGWAGYFSGAAGSWNYFQRNVGIGVLTPGFQLQLSSNSAAKPTSDRWTISSDERLKRNIRPIDNALDDLLRLRGVTYQWRDPESQGGMNGSYTGMIAQEVEKVFPEWVAEDESGYKTLTIIGFEGVVIEAMRELRAECSARLAANDVTLASLRHENRQLRDRLDVLERVVVALAEENSK